MPSFALPGKSPMACSTESNTLACSRSANCIRHWRGVSCMRGFLLVIFAVWKQLSTRKHAPLQTFIPLNVLCILFLFPQRQPYLQVALVNGFEMGGEKCANSWRGLTRHS